jgi:hypothetical protein
MGKPAVVRYLPLTGFKAKESEMELTNTYGNEELPIFGLKKWRTRFLQGRTEFGDDARSGWSANSDLTQVIAELIRNGSFLSCQRLCKHLRVSKEHISDFFMRNSGSKSFVFNQFHIGSTRTKDESLKNCHATSTS